MAGAQKKSPLLLAKEELGDDINIHEMSQTDVSIDPSSGEVVAVKVPISGKKRKGKAKNKTISACPPTPTQTQPTPEQSYQNQIITANDSSIMRAEEDSEDINVTEDAPLLRNSGYEPIGDVEGGQPQRSGPANNWVTLDAAFDRMPCDVSSR